MVHIKNSEPVLINKIFKYKNKPTLDDLLNISHTLSSKDFIEYTFDNISIINSENEWFISINTE